MHVYNSRNTGENGSEARASCSRSDGRNNRGILSKGHTTHNTHMPHVSSLTTAPRIGYVRALGFTCIVAIVADTVPSCPTGPPVTSQTQRRNRAGGVTTLLIVITTLLFLAFAGSTVVTPEGTMEVSVGWGWWWLMVDGFAPTVRTTVLRRENARATQLARGAQHQHNRQDTYTWDGPPS